MDRFLQPFTDPCVVACPRCGFSVSASFVDDAGLCESCGEEAVAREKAVIALADELGIGGGPPEGEDA